MRTETDQNAGLVRLKDAIEGLHLQPEDFGTICRELGIEPSLPGDGLAYVSPEDLREIERAARLGGFLGRGSSVPE